MVHFVGYLRTELSSNLKQNESSVKKEKTEKQLQTENQNLTPMGWLQPKNISNGKSSGVPLLATISNSLATNPSIPTLQNYLITFGKVKQAEDELVEHKFLSRHDAEGKFLYLDTKYIFNIIFKHTIINTFLNSKAI